MFKERIASYQDKELIYLDESGFSLDMPRTHGYSKKGQRCYGVCDWNAKGRVNVIGAMAGFKLKTVSLFNGNINSDVFHSWVDQDLLPSCKKKSVIIMDNASFHKRSDTKALIEQQGHILEFLPPYSPDLNPIEHKWAQAKAIRRRTGNTVEEIFKNNQL